MKRYIIIIASLTEGVQSPDRIILLADEHEKDNDYMTFKRNGEMIGQISSHHIRAWWIEE